MGGVSSSSSWTPRWRARMPACVAAESSSRGGFARSGPRRASRHTVGARRHTLRAPRARPVSATRDLMGALQALRASQPPTWTRRGARPAPGGTRASRKPGTPGRGPSSRPSVRIDTRTVTARASRSCSWPARLYACAHCGLVASRTSPQSPGSQVAPNASAVAAGQASSNGMPRSLAAARCSSRTAAGSRAAALSHRGRSTRTTRRFRRRCRTSSKRTSPPGTSPADP
jgi:hypothetical protein